MQIDKTKLMERLEKHELKTVQVVFDALRKEIQRGDFDLSPQDVCQTCHGVGDVTQITGSTPESYEERNIKCPDCPDVDVKEIAEHSRLMRETGFIKNANFIDSLLTKHTETLAQAEKKDEIIKTLSLTIGSYEKIREQAEYEKDVIKSLGDELDDKVEKLEQAKEALKQISRLDACGNHILIKGVVRDTLQLIGGDEEDADD